MEKKTEGKCFITKSLMYLFLYADHDTAINRYSRLSKRRDNDKVITLVT